MQAREWFDMICWRAQLGSSAYPHRNAAPTSMALPSMLSSRKTGTLCSNLHSFSDFLCFAWRTDLRSTAREAQLKVNNFRERKRKDRRKQNLNEKEGVGKERKKGKKSNCRELLTIQNQQNRRAQWLAAVKEDQEKRSWIISYEPS